jgi:hypothetical protein
VAILTIQVSRLKRRKYFQRVKVDFVEARWKMAKGKEIFILFEKYSVENEKW